jgi:hypothetical protein
MGIDPGPVDTLLICPRIYGCVGNVGYVRGKTTSRWSRQQRLLAERHSEERRCGSPPSWMVSENHSTAPAAFREPLPLSQANPNNCTRCRFHAFIANGGYQTRYPLVAAATSSQLD